MKFPGNFDLARAVEPGAAANALAELSDWHNMAAGTHSAHTWRAGRADAAIIQGFCDGVGQAYYPAVPTTIRAYVKRCVAAGKKPTTIRRDVATLARAHIAGGVVSSYAGEPVRLVLKEMARALPGRQRQAKALQWQDIKQFIDKVGKGLRADRERALL